MLEEIINYIKDICLRHKAVNYFRYSTKMDINQQNNNPYIAVWFEDSIFSQLIITQDIFTVTMNIYFLAFVGKDYTPLQAHSDTFDIANQVLAYIENDDTYNGLLRIHDYSLLQVSKFTDDNCYGQRLTLELQVPVPVNLCTNGDNFTDKPTDIEEKDTPIVLPDKETPDIKLTKIKLPKKQKTCK